MRPIQQIVSVSGGKDSTAVYLLAVESGRPFRAVFADTGNEHPATYDYVNTLAERTGGPAVETVRADFSAQIARKREVVQTKWRADGIQESIIADALEVLHPTGNPYLDLCVWKGRFPSSQAQFCTEELKVLPITSQVILPALKNGPVIQWHGVRAEESRRRAALPRFARDDSGSMIWRPIHRWSIAQVFAIHDHHGIEPNPLYKQGMGRVGCMPCINCGKDEIRAIADRFPEQVARISRWEKIVSLASKRGAGSFFTSTDDPAYEGGNYTIHDRVKWSRTSRGGVSYDLMRVISSTEPQQCESKYGLCE